MGCEKGRSLLRSHACFLGLGDGRLGSSIHSIAGAMLRTQPRQKQVCCAISQNLEMTNIGEDGKRLRSSQSDNTPNPVIGDNYRDVKTKTSFRKPTGTERSAVLKAGHWEGVSKELRSQDSPNRSKTDDAVTPGGPALANKFRSLMRLTPSSVVIVYAEYNHQDEPEKEVFGMLVASFAPVSLDPEPCVSFNIKRPSKTYNQMLQTKSFTILAPKDAMLADAFAKPGNKSSILGQALCEKSGVPKQFSGVLWWAKCELLAEKSVDVGDHTIVVGRVVKVGMPRLSPGRRDVIVYSNGQYRELGPCVPPLDENSHFLGKIRMRLEEGEAHIQPAIKATEELATRDLNVSELLVEQTRSTSRADQSREPFELEASTTPQQGLSQEVAESVVLQEGMENAQQQAPAAELKYYRRYLADLDIQIHNLQEEAAFKRWLIEKLRTQRSAVDQRIFGIPSPKSSLVHRVDFMPPSGDSDNQDEVLENKKRLFGSKLSRELKRSQLFGQKENNQQPLSEEPVSNNKISCPPGHEAMKEASLEPCKMDKKQHGATFDGLVTYRAHKRLSFPSLEQEQAAEQNNHTSAPEAEDSEIQHRPAKLSEGMQGLYDSFSGWMQESKGGLEEPIDGEVIEKAAQSATGTESITSPSGREGEEALARKNGPSATGTGSEKSPGGFNDASRVGKIRSCKLLYRRCKVSWRIAPKCRESANA